MVRRGLAELKALTMRIGPGNLYQAGNNLNTYLSSTRKEKHVEFLINGNQQKQTS